MNHKKTSLFVTILIIGCIVAYLSLNYKSDMTQLGADIQISDSHSSMHSMSDGQAISGDSDMSHMNHMTMIVTSEREFILGMIPHHQEAVDAAKEVIARGGTTPQLRQLVEGIIIAQEKEISKMEQWYQNWYGESYVDNGQYMPMMRELSNLSGVELDKAFLEDMIEHHMGAIMMSQSVLPHIEHKEIEILTKAIITTQAEEIKLMRQILNEL